MVVLLIFMIAIVVGLLIALVFALIKISDLSISQRLIITGQEQNLVELRRCQNSSSRQHVNGTTSQMECRLDDIQRQIGTTTSYPDLHLDKNTIDCHTQERNEDEA